MREVRDEDVRGAGSVETPTTHAPVPPRGRLELTWTNKHLTLLAHEDGSYEWVKPTDHRVKEVRLLREAGTVGEVTADDARAQDNLLIRGDALCALEALTSLPEFAAELVGQVELIYIDPPFNTGQAFEQYDDALEHSVWLTMMRDRLIQLKKLLKPDGSIWVHLDDAEAAYCRAMMDEIFGRECFVANVVWQGRHSRSSDAVFSVSHNHLLVYARDPDRWKGVRNRLETLDLSGYSNPDNDPRGDWRSISFTAPNVRPNLSYEIVAPNGARHRPPAGRCWRTTQEKFEELVADSRIYFGADGSGVPRVKQFAFEASGLVPNTWWPHADVGHSEEAKRELQKLFPGAEKLFSTPKPERLMHRIIHIGSNPGDVVLDCFGGSGTTAAVAHKMGRRWITIERERETVDTFLAPRLKKVVEGDDPGGISDAVSWEGGGGFRVLDVAESMYEEDEGIVVLAEWATNSALAEATAAQLGFDYQPDPPFCGKRGRIRLAVLDGHCDERIVRQLVRALGDGERLSLCATSLDPGAASLLTKLRSGSQARVVPEDVLLSYRTPSAWRVSVARSEANDSEESANGTESAFAGESAPAQKEAPQ